MNPSHSEIAIEQMIGRQAIAQAAKNKNKKVEFFL